MTNEYLVFQTEAEAQTALETIYANMVKEIDSPNVLNVATGQVVDKNSLTPKESVNVNNNNRNFPIFGVNAQSKKKNISDGYTTAWAIMQKTLSNKWVFPKPIDKFLSGVNNYTVENFNSNWFPKTILY